MTNFSLCACALSDLGFREGAASDNGVVFFVWPNDPGWNLVVFEIGDDIDLETMVESIVGQGVNEADLRAALDHCREDSIASD